MDKEPKKVKTEAEIEQELAERAEEFKSGSFSKIILFLAAISAFYAFSGFRAGISAAGYVALSQAGLFVLSWLIGAGKIRIRSRWLHVVLFIAGVVLLGVFMKYYQPAA